MKKVTISSATHPGLKRDTNQDSHKVIIPNNKKILNNKGILLVLADGMGGNFGGEIASEMAVDIITNNYYKDNSFRIWKSLRNSFYLANSQIYNKAQITPKLKNMGTTLTAIVLIKNKIYVAHVGDSRCYKLNDNHIKQITEDHSFVMELIKANMISEEEAIDHPKSNMITRAIGTDKIVLVDIIKKKIKQIEHILICCDGLYREISDEKIHEIVYSHNDPSLACEALVQKAIDNGGNDNITVVLAKIENKY